MPIPLLFSDDTDINKVRDYARHDREHTYDSHNLP
jgi:hypothetical protein